MAPILEIADFGVTYPEVSALTSINLVVTAGERVALIGPSGAGKTTLLSALAGLVPPTAGSIAVFGADPAQLRGRTARAHRSRVGTISQAGDLALPLRVVHNVNAGRLGRWRTSEALWSLIRPDDRESVDTILELVGLAGTAQRRTDALSGGERQRVAVARVLRQRPELVLADEPTSSVDPSLSDRVMGLLCGPPEHAPWTTVVSLHHPGLARRHATRLVGLQHGRILFDSDPDDVTDDDLRHLYGDDLPAGSPPFRSTPLGSTPLGSTPLGSTPR
ncbi:MAG: phosphonate transport system ATP-binding protein [Acidimicrobiales bacterium]